MRFAILLFALGLAACSNGKPAAPAAAAPAPTPTATAPAPTAAPQITKIVFIDKEKACECTQKAIDASWNALQAALQGAALPVERIHMDTQEAFAAGYTAKKPMMAVPGLYFLAEGGALVEMLQGEVTAEAIKAVLKR